MNRYLPLIPTLGIITLGALLILPISINAAESDQTNQNQEIDNMRHHAQRAKKG